MIPLSDEIMSITGRRLKELRVEKGKTVVISVIDYNRCVYHKKTRISRIELVYNRQTSIWGEDAHEFNPARWLNASDISAGGSIGPYASL